MEFVFEILILFVLIIGKLEARIEMLEERLKKIGG